MSSIPLPFAMPGGADAALAVEMCKTRFASLPNGNPSSIEDLLSILVLTAEDAPTKDADPHIVGAKVRMGLLGLGTELNLPMKERLGLYALAAFRLERARAPSIENRFKKEGWDLRATMKALWVRAGTLYKRVLGQRTHQEAEALKIQDQISKLLPEGLSLMPHQLEAVAMAKERRFRYIFADDMGLGKTISLLACILSRGEAAFPISISCPLALTTTWVEESLKWLEHLAPVPVLLDGKTDVREELGKGKNSIFIGSYGQLRLHGGTFQSVGLGTMICDESHYLANRETQRTRAAMLARTRAQSVLLATGTLMPNGRYAEAYSQLKLVDRDAFRHLVKGVDADGRPKGDWFPYARKFCGPRTINLGSDRTVTQYKGRSNDVEFGILLGAHQTRRTKAEVFGSDGLPPKSRHKIWVPVTDKQRMAFARTRDQVRGDLKKRASTLQSELLAKGVKDEVIADKVKRIIGSEAVIMLTKLRVEIGLAKVPWAVQRIKELTEEGHEVLVFCWHNAVAEAAAEALNRAKFGVTLATGTMGGRTRTNAVDALKKCATPVGVLTSAYREGLTLTGYDRIIMLERWWKPGDEMQAEDRIHRIGQTRSVAIEFPVIKGTYDEKIGDLQIWKESGSLQAAGSAEARTYTWLMEQAA